MIDEGYSRRLAEKVAGALVERIAVTEDEAVARADLARIRRLVVDGHIARGFLTRGLAAVQGNAALNAALREEAEAEASRIPPPSPALLPAAAPREGSSIRSSAAAVVDITLPSTDTAAGPAYRSADVIVPARTPPDMLAATGWTPVTGDALAELFAAIGPVDGALRVAPETSSCHWRPLPWYADVGLVRIADPGWNDPDLSLFYLTMKGALYRLDGTSPPIHTVNAEAPIRLDAENAGDYLRFFCFFVRGEEGPFYLAERDDDPMIPEIVDTRTREILTGATREITPAGTSADGCFLFDATVFYSNAAFGANFSVAPSGMIEMVDDDPIAADLPIRIHAPLAWQGS